MRTVAPLLVGLVLIVPFVPGCRSETPDEPSAADAIPEVPTPELGQAQSAPAASVPGFTPIRLDDCEIFHGKGDRRGETWTAEGDEIRTSGQPKGYLYTKRSYRNFTLQCEFRFESSDADAQPPANTGFLVYITPPHKQWPMSLEVQGRQDEMGQIKANGGAAEPERIVWDEAARDKARRPVGEWNRIEIVSRDGALTAVLNGVTVCRAASTELTEGPIGLQSEGFVVHFRNLQVREE